MYISKTRFLLYPNSTENYKKEKKEPAWVVGEQRQLFLDILPCLANPPVVIFSDVGDIISDSVDELISTFISFVVIAPAV